MFFGRIIRDKVINFAGGNKRFFVMETSEYHYFMQRVDIDSDGTVELADVRDLELFFSGLRYKSLSGLALYGAPKGVYSESYAEEDGSDVYISTEVDARESTELELSLYFFCPNEYSTVAEAIIGARSVYHTFMDYLGMGGRVIYGDTLRRRKVLMYLSSAVEVSTDAVCGEPYMEVSLTFTNEYGRSFPYDDTECFASVLGDGVEDGISSAVAGYV